jgi:pre-mRNA-splicing factor ATP-dependent RNA helicase DHX38/PRP16
MDIAKELGYQMTTCEYNYDVVRKAVCSGYFVNASKVKGIGEYVNMRTGVTCKLHMSSALLCLGYIPEYVVYHELVMTSREYMNCVTIVDPHWLAEMGPMFFSIKNDLTKSKAEMDKEGQSYIFKKIEEAKRKKEELEGKRLQEEEVERSKRMSKSNFVVEAGKNPHLGTPRTQGSMNRDN